MNGVVYVCKKILQHIKEYCQEAGIHGPQHIVNQRLAVFERLGLYNFLGFDYSTSENTMAVLIRVALCQKVHSLCQIFDYNSHLWLKFECNSIKKPWTEIRMVPFYLCL